MIWPSCARFPFPQLSVSLSRFSFHFTCGWENSRGELAFPLFLLFSSLCENHRILSVRYTRSLSVQHSFAQHKSPRRDMFTNFSSPFRVVAAKKEKWKFIFFVNFGFYRLSGHRCEIEWVRKVQRKKFRKLFLVSVSKISLWSSCEDFEIVKKYIYWHNANSEREKKEEKKANEKRCRSEMKLKECCFYRKNPIIATHRHELCEGLTRS